MKRILRLSIILCAAVSAVLLCIWLGSGSGSVRRMRTCTGLEVEIADAGKLQFVSKADVKHILDREYGNYSGQRLDSVDLRRIEKILDGRSAILKSEAYTTRDGMLHVTITQREPIVRFRKGDHGFYADQTGFLFPLQPNYTSRVPIIDGNLPLNAVAGYKGEPASDAEKKWLEGVIGLARFLSGSRKWSEMIVQITVDSNGDLIMIPEKGREKFIFGKPDDPEGKFARMETYYRYIAPAKDAGYYSTVNVKYKDRIICRK